MSDQDRPGPGGSRGHDYESQEFGFGRGRGNAGRGRDANTTHRSSHEVDDDSRTSVRLPVDPGDDSGKRARTGDGERPSSSRQQYGREGQRGGHHQGHSGGGDEGHRSDTGTTSEGRSGRRGARRGQREDRDPNDRFDFVQIRTPENRGTKSKQGKTTPANSVDLMANFFPLVKQPNWCLYNYHVDFKPEEENTRMKKKLLGEHRNTLGAYIFDGSTMYTSNRLDSDPMVLTSTRNRDNEIIELTIRNVGEIPPTDFTYLQFYNIIVRKCMETLKFEEIGRRFYDREKAISMPHRRLDLWPGYVTTIRQFEHKVMMCVDVIHKVLRYDTCLTIIEQYGSNSPDQRKVVAEELIDCIVMTHYNRKTYRIDDIAWDKSPSNTFDMRGTDTTYFDYYAKKNIHITDMYQPLLVSRPKKRDTHRGQTGPIYLIPELCHMTGLDDRLRKDFNAMRDLAKHLHQPPDKRFDNVQKFVRRMRDSEEIRNELTTWGLDFGTNLTKLTGHVAPKECIVMKVNNKKENIEPDKKADWRFAFKEGKNMYSVKAMEKWVIIVPQQYSTLVDNLINKMNYVGRGLGFNVPRPVQILSVGNTGNTGYTESINQAMSNHGKNLQMIFVILPGNNLNLYKAVKKRCCIDFGIPSQCFVWKNLKDDGNSNLMSIATKVVIQMNAKLGGEPWAVLNPLKESRLMIIGFDVHHCGKGKGPSVGGMVATTNNDLSTFYSTVSFHKDQTELSGNLCKDVTKCLFAYSKLNQGLLPGRIIMYRDGVGDGQLNHVFNTELAEIKVALEGAYNSVGQPQPKFTLIIVTKKINARIALIPDKTQVDNRQGYNRQPDNPQAENSLSGLMNPKAGTIVDDVITLPERWDFYLISQHANQGTVSPTAYNVIFDQQGLVADQIQRLTYKLTHMYFNWSGTVSVPAVCQYAHKLAYLTGLALEDTAHERLAHTLYYL